MLVDPNNLFQTRPSGPQPHAARPLPTHPLSPQVTGSGFQADGLSVSQMLAQNPPGPLNPLPADEDSYPEQLPEGFVSKLLFTLKSPLQIFHRQDPDTIINTGRKDVRGNTIRLARDAAAGMDKIYAEAKSRGLTLRVVSTYRSIEQQTYLWENALKKYGSAAAARKWVAPPGKSRHNSGKAIDLYMYRNGKQIPQKEFDEVIAKAGMYRPMSWEGWHIEPLSTKSSRK